MSFLIKLLISLSYVIVILFIGCHVYNLIRYTRILRVGLVNLSVRCLHETELIDSCEGCKRVDKSDVRTFGSLNRTHTSVMRIMHISNLESGSVS